MQGVMKVMYIDGDGPLGGASRSLFEVIRPLSDGQVEPHFVAVRGTALGFYRQVAKDIVIARGLSRFDNTRYSYYRRLRWLVVLREIFYLPFTVAALLRAKRRWGNVDLIHVNEFVFILPGLIAKWIFDAPLVVHVRSLVRVDDRSARCRWFNARLRRDALAIVAIDQNVRATLPADLQVDVINNSFTPRHLPDPDSRFLQRLDKLRPSSLKVGFVGNLHVSKGILDLLEAAKLLREAGCDVEFVVIGGVTVRDRGILGWALAKTGLAQNVEADLVERIEKAGLSDMFHLMGATIDIQRAYERIDVIAFPSHFDSPGRPVFEAAFSSVPSIVAVKQPFPDTLVHGETGLAIPGQNPQELAKAVEYLAAHPEEVRRMGANARRLAERNFNPDTNAQKLLALYRRTLQFSRSRP